MKFDRTTPILIYGAGEIGTNITQNLVRKGYYVLAFLDKYKRGIETITGKPIYKFGEESVDVHKSKCIIFICLSDGMLHKSVALELWKEGYQYIICLPMNFSLSSKIKMQLSIRYNLILDGQFSKIKEIESFNNYLQIQLYCKNSVIGDFDDIYIVWLREEILFTEFVPLWNGDKSKVFTSQNNQNINITTFSEYQELFQYLKGERNECEGYWRSSVLKRTPQEKQLILERREELLRTYEREYSFGMDFFIASAPKAIWNEKGYWNLHGGHHRMIFLQQKGHVLFPIRVKKDDFNVWCNKKVLNKVKKYILEHNKSKTIVPVPHPAFLNFEAERELQGDTILSGVLRFLKEKIEPGLSVLDCSGMDGYFARYFARILNGQVTYIGGDDEVDFVKLLNELLHVPQISCERKDKFGEKNLYSLVFMINRFDIDFEESNFQKKMNKIVDKYLFIETTEDESAKIAEFIENTSFQYYQALHREVYLGKMREVGVLMK